MAPHRRATSNTENVRQEDVAAALEDERRQREIESVAAAEAERRRELESAVAESEHRNVDLTSVVVDKDAELDRLRHELEATSYTDNMEKISTPFVELLAGTEIAKVFLNSGDTIAYTAGREPESLKAITTEATPFVTAPLLVLVNHNTASASEIVASALHDNCRAVLVGERTYGKGLIQSVFELHDGSGVVVTIGKYVTPSHLDINGNGLEPDFRNIPSKETLLLTALL